MNREDVLTYKILAEMGLLKERKPTKELQAAYDRAHKSEDEVFLDDVEKLFQIPLEEMAYRTGSLYREYTPEQIAQVIQYTKDAKEVTKLEDGGAFALYQKDNFYILRDGEGNITYGWIGISDTTFHQKSYKHLDIVYILPQFRKKGLSQILFHAVKEIVNAHIIIDGPVFARGEDFINSLAKRSLITARVHDKKTGQLIKDYEPGDITFEKNKVIVVESEKSGLYGQWLPGCPDVKTYIPYFHQLVIESKLINTYKYTD